MVLPGFNTLIPICMKYPPSVLLLHVSEIEQDIGQISPTVTYPISI